MDIVDTSVKYKSRGNGGFGGSCGSAAVFSILVDTFNYKNLKQKLDRYH